MNLKKAIRKAVDQLTQYVIVIVILALLAGWIFSLVSAVIFFKDSSLMQTIIENTALFAMIETFLAMLTKE
jgi:hypothetical protein